MSRLDSHTQQTLLAGLGVWLATKDPSYALAAVAIASTLGRSRHVYHPPAQPVIIQPTSPPQIVYRDRPRRPRHTVHHMGASFS